MHKHEEWIKIKRQKHEKVHSELIQKCLRTVYKTEHAKCSSLLAPAYFSLFLSMYWIVFVCLLYIVFLKI